MHLMRLKLLKKNLSKRKNRLITEQMKLKVIALKKIIKVLESKCLPKIKRNLGKRRRNFSRK